MRSDFYALPYAAQQAIRRGENAERRARVEADRANELEEQADTARVLAEALQKVRGEVAATYGYEPNESVKIKLGMIDGYAESALNLFDGRAGR